MHSGGDDRRGDRDTGKGQGEGQRQLASKPPPFELQGRFEHQRRKQHVEDQPARQRQRWSIGQQRNAEPGDHQADDVR